MDDSYEGGGARDRLGLCEKTAVILDSLPLWVQALVELAASSGIDVVGTAGTPERALRLISELRPTLFITEIDIGEGGIVNLDVVREARGIYPDLRVIVLSKESDKACISASFAAGADVYVLKNADPSDVATGMRQAFGQSIFVASQWAPPDGRLQPVRDGLAPLTRRELEILQLVAEGHTNRAIASRLWLTEQTIKFHLSNIYRKLTVSNRTEASRWAQLNGLLPLKHATNGVARAREQVTEEAEEVA